MRRLLPTGSELAIFATLALICATLVGSSQSADLRLAGLAMPIFLAAGILGMRRNNQLARIAEPADTQVAPSDTLEA